MSKKTCVCHIDTPFQDTIICMGEYDPKTYEIVLKTGDRRNAARSAIVQSANEYLSMGIYENELKRIIQDLENPDRSNVFSLKMSTSFYALLP